MKYFFQGLGVWLLSTLLIACGGSKESRSEDSSSASNDYSFNRDVAYSPSDYSAHGSVCDLSNTAITSSASQNNESIVYQGVCSVIHYTLPASYPTSTLIVQAADSKTEIIQDTDNRGFFGIYHDGNQAPQLRYNFYVDDVLVESSEETPEFIGKSPLYAEQWSLKNYGQFAYSDEPGELGEDINIIGVHKHGILGKGVRIAVVDKAVQTNHEDLINQIDLKRSYDFTVDKNAIHSASSQLDAHGTMVAGIIGMQGWNGKGGIGVAPNAILHTYNFLDNQSRNTFFSSIGYDDVGLGANTGSEEVDIFNLSFGVPHVNPDSYGEDIGFYWKDFYRCATTGINHPDYHSSLPKCESLRGGLGGVYVSSAGNDFISNQNDHPNCLNLNNTLSCDIISGAEVNNTNPYVIKVGAINAQGKKSSYSSAGSGLWISAPGGEFGISEEVVKTIDANYGFTDGGKAPALISTDLSSCSKGYGSARQSFYISGRFYSVAYTPFEGRSQFPNGFFSVVPHEDNPRCNYTSRGNGTSASAPIISGVIALMLEVNHQLTWRDVKHILAQSARQVDANSEAYTRVLADGSFDLRLGWKTNGAGYHFHNWFGFGAVDALKAVSLAQTYRDHLSNAMFAESAWKTATITQPTIANNSVNGAKAVFSVPANDGIAWLDSLQLRLGLDQAGRNQPFRYNLRVTSPSGMQSQLLHAHNSLEEMPDDMFLISNAFYGEDPSGDWTIEIIDSFRSSYAANLQHIHVRFTGQKAS